MTLKLWWDKLKHVLSGRAAIDRHYEAGEITPVDLPTIDPPLKAPPVDGADKERLTQRQREHDVQLARLRAIARARGQRS